MQATHRRAGSNVTGKLFTCVAASLCGLMAASSLHAATIAHYRFEEGAFLEDSAGDNDLTNVGSATQYALPEIGVGSSFPNPIPQTGDANAHALRVDGSNYVRTAPFTGLKDFTFEAFFNLSAPSTSTQYIGGQSGNNTTGRSWAIGVADSDGTGTAGANELFALLSANGQNNSIVPLGLTVAPETDYYIAFAFDGDSNTNDIKLYYQNLTAGGAMPAPNTVSSGLTELYQSTNDFQLGAYSGGNGYFDGIIDEARLSDETLTQSQLLAVVPEPAALSLLGLGALGLLSRRRAAH